MNLLKKVLSKKFVKISFLLLAVVAISSGVYVLITGEYQKNLKNPESVDSQISPKRTGSQPPKALMLVIENNQNFPIDTENEEIFRDLLPFVLSGVSPKDLENKSIEEIVDEYLEDFMAERILKNTKIYDKTLYLTDKEASYESFKNELLDLNKSGYEIDILLNLHGGEEKVIFYDGEVDSNQLRTDLAEKNLNIGFIYQTLCYGSSLIDDWEVIGAEHVNGARGLNTYVLLSPIKFMENIEEGDSFRYSVEQAKSYEISIYKLAKKVFPSIEMYLTDEVREQSSMDFN